jgi:hypothetical protein
VHARRSARWLVIALVGLGALAAAAAADGLLAVGSTLAPRTLPDQHGSAHAIDASVRVVLFTRDMKGGGIVKEALQEDGRSFLERHHALYVSDVSRMPAFIRVTIAKPRLRGRDYPILLDEEGQATADFPAVEGKATLLFLDGLRVVRIEQAGSVDDLRHALEPQPAR